MDQANIAHIALKAIPVGCPQDTALDGGIDFAARANGFIQYDVGDRLTLYAQHGGFEL